MKKSRHGEGQVIKKAISGVSGWPSQLSICFQLGSWSQGPGMEPHIGESAQQVVFFSLYLCFCSLLMLTLSLSFSLSPSCSLSLSLKWVNKIFKKNAIWIPLIWGAYYTPKKRCLAYGYVYLELQVLCKILFENKCVTKNLLNTHTRETERERERERERTTISNLSIVEFLHALEFQPEILWKNTEETLGPLILVLKEELAGYF